jgi:hypothetical protein
MKREAARESAVTSGPRGVPADTEAGATAISIQVCSFSLPILHLDGSIDAVGNDNPFRIEVGLRQASPRPGASLF